MTTRIILLLGFSLITLRAGETSPEDLLRQGLFEEEANHDLGKATAAYQAVIAAHERQRGFAAAATFRLGEIARKKNDKEAAAAAFRAVVERFPEQAELARLSLENLATLGMAPAGETPAAVLTNDPEDAEIARLKEIARDSPDLINGAGSDGWRPLHHAAAKGWTRVVSFLLENHAEPNSLTLTEQLTPLQIATVHGYLGVVKTLLAAKADINANLEIERCPKGLLPITEVKANESTGRWSALDLSILYDRLEVFRALLEAGAEFKQVGPVVLRYRGEITPLALAIYLDRVDLAQTLIEAGVPLGHMDARNLLTPLAVAVSNSPEMVGPLLKAGADPKLAYCKDGLAPIHDLARTKGIEVAKLLIDAGADVAAKDAGGRTPLHFTFRPEMIDFLISKGADINAKTISGLTPLDVFAESEYEISTQAIKTFYKHGATVEDPIALLRRTSDINLSTVQELFIYPRASRPDAILLYVADPNPRNRSSSSGTDRMPRPRIIPQPVLPNGVSIGRSVPVDTPPPQKLPDLMTLESRPSEKSLPPSVAEVLCEAFGADQCPQFIRIMRRAANGRFESIHSWRPIEGAKIPTDWPALRWGDVVEVTNSGYNHLDKSLASIGDFTALIPARTITLRLGGMEIPKTIPGSGVFWLDSNQDQALKLLLPGIALLADPSHILIHRKGTAEPIPLDLSKPTETRFRLIDGDTVELTPDIARLSREFGEADFITQKMLHEDGGFAYSNEKSLAGALADYFDYLGSNPIDFRKILILRRAENWKPEIVDFKATLDALPQTDEWNKEALEAASPKLNRGDMVILIEDQTKNAKESAPEILRKLKIAFGKTLPPPR